MKKTALTPLEQSFLSWFETELRKRLAEEHIVIEESLFSVGELMEQATKHGLAEGDNLPIFGANWERIGGPQLSAKIIREYRKAHPENTGPSPMRVRNPNAEWRNSYTG